MSYSSESHFLHSTVTVMYSAAANKLSMPRWPCYSRKRDVYYHSALSPFSLVLINQVACVSVSSG